MKRYSTIIICNANGLQRLFVHFTVVNVIKSKNENKVERGHTNFYGRNIMWAGAV